jgi:raffinose/stachyose/melibiose transport system substrate-binding protein
MYTKRFSSAICLLIVILLLAACAPTAPAATEAKGGKTIVIYMEDDFIRDSYTDFYKAYEEATGNTVKAILVPKDQYVQNLTVALNGNQQIDVLYMNGQDVRSLASKGVICEMRNRVNYWDRFNQSAIDQFTYGGKIFAVPTNAGNTSGVYYNKELLDKYQLPVPKTFEDLVAIRDVLAADDISVFAFGGASKYMWPMWYFDAFAQTSGGKSIERTVEVLQGNAKFTDPDFVAAMRVLEKFGKEGLFQAGFNGAEQAQGNAVFTAGKSALFFGGTWEVDGFRKAGLERDKLGVTAFPIVVSGSKSQQTGSAAGAAMSLNCKIDPENEAAALQLIDYLSSDAKVLELSTLDNTAMSPNKNFAPKTADPLYTNVINQELAPTTVTFLDWIWPPEVVTAFQNEIQAVVGGQTTSEEAMDRIQAVLDQLIEGGYSFGS